MEKTSDLKISRDLMCRPCDILRCRMCRSFTPRKPGLPWSPAWETRGPMGSCPDLTACVNCWSGEGGACAVEDVRMTVGFD